MANKKTVVHFTSSLKRGGAEAILSSLVEDLQNSFEQTVLYVHDGPQRKQIECLGIRCIQIYGALSMYDPVFIYRAYKIIHALKPDVLHTLLWSATVCGRMVGYMLAVPVVSVYHGNLDQNGAVRNFFDRKTMSLSVTNCAVSSGVARSITAISPYTPVSIIHNGINCSDPKSAKKRADIGLSDDQFVIGAVGRFVAIKRFDILIDALALLHKKDQNVRLCLIGTGPELGALQKRAQQHSITHAVIFLVDVPAVEYYHLFDCFVLPSPREGISIALLEAMRVSLAVLVVSQDDQHPVVEHECNGLVIQRVDAQHLADAINDLKKSPLLAQGLGNAAYGTVTKHFNRNVMIEQYTQMFLAAMNR